MRFILILLLCATPAFADNTSEVLRRLLNSQLKLNNQKSESINILTAIRANEHILNVEKPFPLNPNGVLKSPLQMESEKALDVMLRRDMLKNSLGENFNVENN
jgi:hypothetical protein